MNMEETSGSSGRGPATDRHNSPVLDPTPNVLDLVDATERRIDDLRTSDQGFTSSRSKALRREVHSEIKGLRRELHLHIRYKEKLAKAESGRLDSIRAVDVAASLADRVVGETRATTLATATTASAEALRSQVAETAAAQTIALDNKIAPVQKDISDLREVQYKQQGERAQAIESRVDSRDSAAEMAPILLAIEELTLAQAAAGGGRAQVAESRAKSGSVGLWIGLAIAGAGVLGTVVLGVAGIIVTLLLTTTP